MVNLAKPDTPMDDWHDDNDDSSVESEFQEEEEQEAGGCAVVITIDDMSVASAPRDCTPRSKSKFHQAGSFVSVLSTESSLDCQTDIVPPPSSDRRGTQNATWNKSLPPGAPATSRNQNERCIAFSTAVPVHTTLRKEGTSTRKGLLQRDSSLNDSCGSIKGLLGFGSTIHENSIGSSDEEDESSDDESYEEVPRNIMDMHDVLRNMMETDVAGDAYSEHEESSLVHDSVVNMIIHSTTTDTNKDQTLQAGKRSTRISKHSIRNRIPKVQGVTGDALLNRFLDSKHEKDSPTRGSQRAIPSFLPVSGRLELTINNNDLKFDSMMRKTDSLNHVNKQGQRVVKTMHEHHNTSRRGSILTAHQDPLMERFLSSETRMRQRQFQHGNLLTKARGGDEVPDASLSLNRVDGNGHGLLGTRLGGI